MESYSFLADRSVEHHHKSDITFLVSLILLLGLGIFTQYVCTQETAAKMFGNSFYFVKRQLLSMLFGLAGFGFISTVKVEKIRKALPFILGVTLILCILTFIPALSVEKNGARRWLKMPFGFTLQSSELVKFSIVLFLANLFDKQLKLQPEERNVMKCVGVLLFFTILVLLQKDLSTAVFIFVVCVLMFWAAGLKVRWVFAVGVLAVPLLILFVANEPYRLDRIVGFLRPDEGLSTINYQSTAAKKAISAGGFWGSGIGTGLVQSSRIPEVQADYIFAGWVEAMGLFGVILYLIVLGIFTWRGLRISFICKNRFAAFGAFGFTAMIFLQSLLNIAVVSGGLPTTGIPLPFFSLGGSSIIISLFMCGFIVNSSRIDIEEETEETEVSSLKEADFKEVLSLDDGE